MSGLPVARTCPGLGEASDLKFPLGAKFREPLTETRFQQLFGDAKQELEPLAEPRLSRLCRQWRRRARACSGPGAWRLLLARLPPLRWLPHYRWRAWLLGDAVAGVTVGIVHVPQGERPQHSPVWGPSSGGRREGAGAGNLGARGWVVWLRVRRQETKFWVRTTEPHQIPTPSSPHLRNPSRSLGYVLGQGTGERHNTCFLPPAPGPPPHLGRHGSVTLSTPRPPTEAC